MKIVYILFLTGLLLGCSLPFMPNKVMVRLPSSISLPMGLVEEDLRFDLLIRSAGKTSLRQNLTWGEEALLDFPKDESAILLAYPKIRGVSDFEPYPAGGIFPDDVQGERLLLSWKKGFLCEILRRYSETGGDPDKINREALEKRILEAAKGKSLWKIDWNSVAIALASGKFRWYDVHLSQRHTLDELPFGMWWSGDFEDAPVSVDGENPFEALSGESSLLEWKSRETSPRLLHLNVVSSSDYIFLVEKVSFPD